jgi:hypothetical protein
MTERTQQKNEEKTWTSSKTWLVHSCDGQHSKRDRSIKWMQGKKRGMRGVEEENLGKNLSMLMQVSCSGIGTFYEVSARLRAVCLPWVGCGMLLLIIAQLARSFSDCTRNAPSNPG